ncbi:small heat shock protein, chloroplastic-like protein, partial [Tanacetum coccineum]
ALPENIQFEKIKAEVKDGALYVTIPKAPVTSKILDINVQ